ncbi:hypothetical protein MMEU_2784 [Mycobacterium marinum str. Europe]|nr:hypothetical protein MMEU_2784 [Mycobacterium marinum str. Europe]
MPGPGDDGFENGCTVVGDGEFDALLDVKRLSWRLALSA